MTDAISTGIPRRLMDKTVATLLAVVVLFVLSWAAIVWVKANNAELKNVEQDGQIKAIVDKLGGISGKQDRQDDKLDRILERLPK